ncbi:acyltransferase family protein [Pseudomonas petrae]|uniref:acyltransferase family protein n=1 Tax=Pseudomonas petrae TaxID=2912190 RepID=UPI001F2E9F3B|nr:acyltransferase [Pseudomonas petrae]
MLDGFRGICALSVAVYHIHIPQSFGEWAFFRNAHYLVSFFFVLSGFVMVHTYGQRLATTDQFKQFFITRTFRLYPLHVFVLLLAIALEVMKLGAENAGIAFNQPSFTGQRAPQEIIPNLLLLQSWWPGFNPQSFNFPAWSISVEYYIYMIFAGILLCTPRFATLIFLMISLMATVCLSLGLAYLMEPALQGLSCFFAGVMTYHLYRVIHNKTIPRWLHTALEVVGVCLTVSLLVSNIDHKQIILTLGFCALMLIFSFEGGVISTLLKARPFEKLGALSYSIYMTHAMVLFAFTLAMILVGKVAGNTIVTYAAAAPGPMLSFHDEVADNFLLIGLLILIVGISAVSHRLIELRSIEWGKRLRSGGRTTLAINPMKTLS